MNETNSNGKTSKSFKRRKESNVSFHDETSNSIIESSVEKEMLERTLFFACETCNGPLIPNLTCPICKRASSRICQKCQVQMRTGNHQVCIFVMMRKLHKNN